MAKVCVREGCDVAFDTKDKRKMYCSRSCAAIVNNTVYPKRYRKGNTKCLNCNEKLFRYQDSFCSRKCDKDFKKKSYIEDWLSGNNNGSRASGQISSTIRNYLLEKANYHCKNPDCAVPGGWSVPNPITGKPILTIDHIDGNWKNNSVDNLIVLCYSCHTLTETFGALNIGSVSGSRPYIDKRNRNKPH